MRLASDYAWVAARRLERHRADHAHHVRFAVRRALRRGRSSQCTAWARAAAAAAAAAAALR